MNISDINFEIEKLENSCNKLKNRELLIFATKFQIGIENIITTLSIPLSFLAHGLRKSKAFHFSLQDSQKIVMNSKGYAEKDPKKTAQELVDYFTKLLKEKDENIVNEASDEINLLINNVAEVRNSYKNLSLNALINVWTIYEAISKDLWIYLVNKYPHKFISNINKISNPNDSQFSFKSISINDLEKYQFDVSKCMGTILSSKYDFTSSNGINKAFSTVLGLKKEKQLITNKYLFQLENIRHLIVHNGGIIDENFVKKTKYSKSEINTEIYLEKEEIEIMINSCIDSFIEILSKIDEKL